MKLRFSLLKKEASLEADVEGLVTKGLENKVNNPNRKTRYQIKQEEKRKNKELEQKQFMQGIALMIGLVIVVFIISIIGTILGIK